MPTLHSASLLKVQCGIVGMNHTTYLDPPRSALRVSDALFISLEAQSQQTEITVISGSPMQLRKQSEKFNFGFLGHLRLHICITDLRVKCPRYLTISVKITNVGCGYKICCQKWALKFIPCSRVNNDIASRTLAAHLTPSNVHCHTFQPPNAHPSIPKHPSKDSTESPDSQTLFRLFPRIPRQGITFST
ncbi:hypothetical protein CRG98_027353 [Punica granatum]|uniref:Uncharacterized protein n=1 Tax=Punica granatum TaxID=22663 RepID=A0A2I0J7P1_PUNGR|nr:hypothetical protein CRG98_027353 [Punica granatum]